MKEFEAIKNMMFSFEKHKKKLADSVSLIMNSEDDCCETLYILSIKIKIEILLESRDEGQWSDPKVEPIWITATKQVLFIESDSCMVFFVRVKIRQYSSGLQVRMNSMVFDRLSTVRYMQTLYHFERRSIMPYLIFGKFQFNLFFSIMS
jgi:hypothetical protein